MLSSAGIVLLSEEDISSRRLLNRSSFMNHLLQRYSDKSTIQLQLHVYIRRQMKILDFISQNTPSNSFAIPSNILLAKEKTQPILDFYHSRVYDSAFEAHSKIAADRENMLAK